MRPAPQLVPSGWEVPDVHRMPIWPFVAVTDWHDSFPSHPSPLVQSPALAHDRRQLVSQPLLGPFSAPKSHCSPVSSTPSPHVPAVQAPALQVAEPAPAMHVAPFRLASGTSSQTPPLQVQVRQGGFGPQSTPGLTQLTVQSLSQPSPETMLPSSHSSFRESKTPSPQKPFRHWPTMHTRRFPPHAVPSGSLVEARHKCVASSQPPDTLHGFASAQLRVGSAESQL
jgi:hypothetical protein